MSEFVAEELVFFNDESVTTGPSSAVLNKRRLKQIVENEGFHFAESRSRDEVENAKTVIFLTTDQMYAVFPAEKLVGYELGCLERFTEEGWVILPLTDDLTKQSVVSWLKMSKDNECIVCFENTGLKRTKAVLCVCSCGALLCFGCRLDLMRTGEFGPALQCPNCRVVGSRHSAVTQMFNVLCTKPSVEGMSAEQLAFISKWMCYDGTKTVELFEATRMQWLQISNKLVAFAKVKKKKQLAKKEFSLEEWVKTDEFLDKVFAEYRSKCSAHTSASGGSCEAPKRRDSCGNCGKSFWDKKEWRRAPKCPTCKRVAYCNAKCRKKHRKTHTGECTAIHRKPKAAKKPKKACRPY